MHSSYLDITMSLSFRLFQLFVRQRCRTIKDLINAPQPFQTILYPNSIVLEHCCDLHCKIRWTKMFSSLVPFQILLKANLLLFCCLHFCFRIHDAYIYIYIHGCPGHERNLLSPLGGMPIIRQLVLAGGVGHRFYHLNDSFRKVVYIINIYIYIYKFLLRLSFSICISDGYVYVSQYL